MANVFFICIYIKNDDLTWIGNYSMGEQIA